MSVVWIPKAAGHDFQSAERFGELRFIFSARDPYFNPEVLGDIAERALVEWQEGDWLLLSGPALMNAVAFHVLARSLVRVPLLVFHAKEEKYVQRYYGRPGVAHPGGDVPGAGAAT